MATTGEQASSSMLPRRTWVLIGRLTIFLIALYTLLPFLTAILWGAILAVIGAPVFRRMLKLTGGRDGPALILSALLAAFSVVIPGILFAFVVVDYLPEAYAGVRRLSAEGLPSAPADITNVSGPVGEVARAWNGFASSGSLSLQEFGAELDQLIRWLFFESKLLGVFVAELVLGVLLSLYLLANRRRILDALERLVEDALGERGLSYMRLSAITVRTLASSLLVGSLAQTVTVGLALVVLSVPHAALFTVLTFIATMIQIGPLVVWVPIAVWMGVNGQLLGAILLTVWGLTVVNVIDNVLRSMMLSRTRALPFVVALLSSIGGLIKFGILGMFVGPVAVDLALQILRFRLMEMAKDKEAAQGEQSAPGEAHRS